jgi:hypothetical protein
MNDALWAICRFRYYGPHLLLTYSDSTSDDSRRFLLREGESWLREIEPLLHALFVRAVNMNPGAPYPVAVYYSFAGGVEIREVLQRFTVELFEIARVAPVQLVRMASGKRLRRSPLRLPLSILFAPEVADLAALYADLQHSPLFNFGVHLEVLKGDLELTLRSGSFSIVVSSGFAGAAPMLGRLPESVRPRLFIDTGLPPDSSPDIPGLAFLRLFTRAPLVIHAFLSGIAHDLPLHHALWSTPHPGALSLLTADPLTNQSLRLSEPYAAMKRQVDRVHAWYGVPAEPEPSGQFRSAVQNGATADSSSSLREGAMIAPTILRIAGLSGPGETSPPKQPSGQPGVRCFDASLSRVETAPPLTPVKSTESLLAGAVYELRVHIGNRFPESLVAGEVAAMDSLVGPPDSDSGHQLEICVQGKDFRVVSIAVHNVLLPPVGSTVPVYFQVRTPERYGDARLRITVHHRNHLIQSFLLTAQIADSEKAQASLEIRQEFARSEQFTNLDQLQPRDLYLGFNQGQATHELMIKTDQATSELNLSAGAYSQAVNDLRQALNEAVIIPNLNMARTYPIVAPGNQPGIDASNAFRNLAKLGNAVYLALFSALPRGAIRKAMVRLQTSSGDKIQVVRFEPRSAFPWALLYDWDLPDEEYNAPPAAVCLGYDAAANPCAHGPNDRVYCVRGFWGVRHEVEELLEQQRNASQTVPKPSADIIRIAASTNLVQATTLQANLAASCGTGTLASGPSQESLLLDLLWQDPPVRPAVLIVLGHFETEQKPGEPDTPRVELQPSTEWLTLKHLLERASKAPDEWNDPRTIVIFAPCGGAATSTDTLNDFVTALNSAGAGAIIGMQSTIGGDQATDFAEKLTTRLWAYDSLGEAMQKVRSETIMSGDPGGFLLQSFGDIDLKLQ